MDCIAATQQVTPLYSNFAAVRTSSLLLVFMKHGGDNLLILARCSYLGSGIDTPASSQTSGILVMK